MRVINAGYQIITPIDGEAILRRIEEAGRVCYKSEDKITDGSCRRFVKMLIERGHESMLEHGAITVKYICDRGVSHEVVRHRMSSYAQESTRYCNYAGDKFGNEITVIMPCFWEPDIHTNAIPHEYALWYKAMINAERSYLQLIEAGATPERARTVLPSSLKTEIIATMNIREWRHVLRLRTSPKAHPQMREVMVPLLAELKTLIPVVFDDIMPEVAS